MRFTAFLAFCLIPAGFLNALDLPNGGFEDNDGKAPKGWAVNGAKGEVGPIFIDNAEAHSGRFSVAMRHTSNTSYSSMRLKVTVKPSTEYTVSVWMKGQDLSAAPGGSAGMARLFLEAEGGKTLAASSSEKGTFSWKRVKLTFTSGPGDTLPIILYLHRGSGTVWFDDLELVEGKGLSQTSGESSRSLLPGVNLALGKPYTLSKAPNYALCNDEGDMKQLTDGQLSEGYFWVQKSTVGWQNAGHMVAVVDLGATEPIRELALGTAGGSKSASVFFPDAAFFVSEDNKNFYLVGRVMGAQQPEVTSWKAVRYHLNDLATKGRYVAVALVANGNFMFADEIEVIKGEPSSLAKNNTGTPYAPENLATAVTGLREDARVMAKMSRALNKLEPVLQKLAPALMPELSAARSELAQKDFNRAQVPALQNKIGVLCARAAQTVFPGKTVVIHRGPQWGNYSPNDIPAAGTQALAGLDLEMGRGEYETTSFSLFNAGLENMTVVLSVEGLSGKGFALEPGDLVWRTGEWTEAIDGEMRPDALPLLDGKALVAPGSSRMFWLTAFSGPKSSGLTTGVVKVTAGKEVFTVPLSIQIHPVSLPRPLPLATYNWAYLNFAPVASNIPSALADLVAHGIDTAVIHPSQQPKMKFGLKGELLETDFSAFDEALGFHLAVGIKKFWLFSAFGDNNRGITQTLGSMNVDKTPLPLGSTEWKSAMKAMVAAITARMKGKGLGYQNFVFYPIDEPKDRLIDQGGKTIWDMFKEADPKVQVFVDPIPGTSLENLQKIAPSVDIWCPHLAGTLDDARLAFYKEEQKKGKKFVAYNCQGPDKTFAPLGHYRRMVWQAWEYGMEGLGHWAYADSGSPKTGTSAWSDFDGGRTDYSIIYDLSSAPAHVSKREAQIPSRRWEAWRDGVEDYAWLWLLKDRLGKAKGKPGMEAKVARGEKVLTQVVGDVLGNPDDLEVYVKSRRALFAALGELVP